MNKKYFIGLSVLLIAIFSGIFVSMAHAQTYTSSQVTSVTDVTNTMPGNNINNGGDCGNDIDGDAPVSDNQWNDIYPPGFYQTPDQYCTQTGTQWWVDGGNPLGGDDVSPPDRIYYYAHKYVAYATGLYHTVPSYPGYYPNSSYAVVTSASLSANPTSIVKGNSAVLSWSSTSVTSAALSCTGTGFNTGGATSGSVTVSPTSTTNYSVTCSGPDQTATANATLTVVQPATLAASCSASPSSITTGQSSTWTAAVSGGIAPYTYSWSGSNGLSGSNTSETVTYPSIGTGTGSLTVSDSGVNTGHQSTTVNCSNNVSVTQFLPDLIPGTAPTVTISLGQPANVSGTVTNQGNGPTGASFTNLFATDLNSSGTAWGTIQNVTPQSSALAAGGTSSFSSTFPASDFPTTGSYPYAYCVNLDSNYQQSTAFTESNNSNNCSNWGTIVVTAPNITATTGVAATATQNVPVTLSGTVTNNGLGTAGSFPSIVQICDWNGTGCTSVNTILPATTVSSLAQGASQAVSASYTPPAVVSGLEYRVCGDETTSWSNAIPESDYTDNCGAFQPLTVNYPPVAGSCSASPTTVVVGSPVTWTASGTGGSGSYTYQWGGSVSGTSQTVQQSYPSAGQYTGQVVISSAGQNYTAMCSPGGTATPVTVISCTPSFTANPTTVTQGQASTLTWSENSLCASSCTGTGFSTGNALSGTASVVPGTVPTTSYALTCGSQPAVNTSINVNVASVNLSASPKLVSVGEKTALTWTSNYTNACTITRGGVPVAGGTGTSGVNVPDPTPITQQTLYTATCTTAGSPVTATALVNIVPAYQEF